MLTNIDQVALDAAALAHRAEVLPMIIDKNERVASQLRALNWSGALRSAFVRVDERGQWSAIVGDVTMRGVGFVELVAGLASIAPDQAAAFLAGLLRALGVAA